MGSAATPAEALAGLASAHADAVLVDLGLGEFSGVDLIRQLTPLHPSLHIMAHTALDDRGAVFQAIQAEPPAMC